MASVEINIGGKNYRMACDPGEEERVRSLGRIIDERARPLGPLPSDAQRFLMIALMLADELGETKTVAAPPAAVDDTEMLVAAVDHLSERVADIAKKLQSA